ncbi:LamG domain-containing protein [bacterium]|nr:LamG domain-containing protein [bacterium]
MKVIACFLLAAALQTANAANSDYCLEFDGKNARAEVTQVTGIQSLNLAAKYTFEVWVRPRTQGGGGRGRILDQEGSSLTLYLSDEGRIGFRANRESGWQLSEAKSVSLWEWQHIAVTADGRFLRFFVDGKLVTAVPTNTALSITKKPLFIGNGVGEDNSPRGFDGWIDDVRISDHCLWTKDFTPPARGVFRESDPSTVLYFTFDEGPAHHVALDYSTYNAELEVESPMRRSRSPR